MYSVEAQLELGEGRLSSAAVPAGELRKQKRLYGSSWCRLRVRQCGDATYSSKVWLRLTLQVLERRRTQFVGAW